MILDDLDRMKSIDKSNMLLDIQTLPDQLQNAWHIAGQHELPEFKNLEGVTISGMGGSAIGADILAAYVSDKSTIPVNVFRGYTLPEWVKGSKQLVICSSHSGNTEETVSVFEEALKRKCSLVAVSRNGRIKELALQNNVPFIQFQHDGQPRSAVGFSFGILLNIFSRLRLIPEQAEQITRSFKAMKKMIVDVDIHVPVVKNLAKRIAGQAFDRQPVIIGAEHLEPIARRWKTQINEIAKGWAGFEFIPEANHNTLAGLEFPEVVLSKLYALFLSSESYHPRNGKRFNLTFDQFMVAGLCTDKIVLPKGDKLDEIWRFLILGDYISYYLAMMYEVDPTPIESLESFKIAMKS